jgi:hypothetical protein
VQGKHVFVETNRHPTVEDTVFYIRPMLSNGAVNTCQRQRMERATAEERLETVSSIRSMPWLVCSYQSGVLSCDVRRRYQATTRDIRRLRRLTVCSSDL